jgi:filamentous hemagglutinin family protein
MATFAVPVPQRLSRLTPIGTAVAIALGALPHAGFANPDGGVVRAGQASIVQTSPNRLDIVQSSARAAIDWRSFSIGAAEHVNFRQPSASAATLNRVLGADPSVILGRLTANGQVFLVNRNGILFGQGAKVDVGALVATTSNISNPDFMAGRLAFEGAAHGNATIVNRGEITAAQGGLVALVAPGVENAGVIRAEVGRVALASGSVFTLDLYGDRLVRLAVDDAALDRLTDVEGRSLRSLVANTGRIEAASVLLAANAAKSVLDAAVNMSGVIEARGFEQRGGDIVLLAGPGAAVVSGRLDASAIGDQGNGGTVRVVAERLDVTPGARVLARGGAAGGDGGFVELSGRQTLSYRGAVDASAPHGRPGTLLLDPLNWIIDAADADRLSLDLRGGTSVVLQADNLIQVNDSIDGRGGAAGATLSLDAGNRIELNNDLMTNNGAITLRAGAGGVQMGTGSRASGGNGAVLFAGNQTIDVQSAGSIAAQHLVTSGALIVRATAPGANVSFARDLNGLPGTPVGSLDVSAANNIAVGGLDATGAALLNAGGTLSFTPSATASFTAGSVNATASGAVTLGRDVVGRGTGAVTITSTGGALSAAAGTSVASQGGGAVTLTSANRLTVADIFTSGAARLESILDTVDLTRDLLGAAGTNGLGSLTIRSGTALTIDNALRASGGIDIRAGGITGVSARDLIVALAPAARLEANVGNTGVRQPVALGGARVDFNAGELHSNGGAVAVDARSGPAFMAAGAGVFAGAGNITVNATGAVDLTRLSSTGALAVTSTGGAIRLDGDLGANLDGSPQRIGSVTLNAGGSFLQDRTYFTSYNFTVGPDAQTPPTSTVQSAVGVRVRGIDANGPVTITASQPGAEILTDGIIKTNGNVTLDASTVRPRHSIFATGGDITVDGALLVEPWGDEMRFGCGAICNAGAADPFSLVIASDTFRLGNARGSADTGAPGTLVTDPARYLGPGDIYGAVDRVVSQLTLRATASGGIGGHITLTGSAGRELGLRSDQQYVRFDREALGLGFVEPADSSDPLPLQTSRSGLALVPMNNLRLTLESSAGVTFRAGAGGNFQFVGPLTTRHFPASGTNDINQPYLHLVIAGATGVPDATAQTVVNALGVPVPSGFAGYLNSVNQVPASTGGSAEQVASVQLAGLTLVSSFVNPSGTEAPPGPTSVTAGSFVPGEITPGSVSGSGTGAADGTGGGITLADARPIDAPPPPPPPAPEPPPAPPPSPVPPPAPEPSPEPVPAPAPDTRTADETVLATLAPGSTGFDAGADLLKVADLGRGTAMRGSAVDVFRARSSLADLAGPSSEADRDYFSLSPFDYLLRRRSRGGR